MLTAIVAGLIGLSIATLANPTDQAPKGYLAEPKSGHGHGVLVLHPWWGLNQDVKTYCDSLAKAGYTAFAPDHFDGKTAKTPAEAEALVNAYEPKHAELEKLMEKATTYLAEKAGKPEIAVIGFSFGAYYALHLSNADPAHVRAVVVYYGTGQQDFSKSKADYLGHFADTDDFEPKANIDGLAKLLENVHRPAALHTYPHTGHWFAEPSVKSAYNEPAAQIAWTRTLDFLAKTLKG